MQAWIGCGIRLSLMTKDNPQDSAGSLHIYIAMTHNRRLHPMSPVKCGSYQSSGVRSDALERSQSFKCLTVAGKYLRTADMRFDPLADSHLETPLLYVLYRTPLDQLIGLTRGIPKTRDV